MTPPPSSRKRSRDSEAEVPAWDGDTIAVLPRRPAAVQDAEERAPLRETRTRANKGTQRRIARRIEIVLSPSPSQPALSPPQTSALSSDVIPQHCCYFCRTRGGFAAFQCAFTAGSVICNRCISDKKKTCRPPTSEELQAIAARCDRCTIRGFKKCDGQTPCDVCLRNHTTHLCRRARAPLSRGRHAHASPAEATSNDGLGPQLPISSRVGTRTRPNTLQQAGAADDHELRELPATSGRASRSRVKRDNAPLTTVAREEDLSEQAVVVERARKRRKVDINRHTTGTGDGQPKTQDNRGMTIDESQQDTREGHPSLSLRTMTRRQTVGSEDLAMGEGFDHNGVHNSEAENSHHDHSALNNISPSSSASEMAGSTSATEDDDSLSRQPQHMRESQKRPESSARPRRSRGRVSYVEVFPDAILDEDLEPHSVCEDEDEDESDLYSSKTSGESDVDEESGSEDSVIGRSSAEESTDEEEASADLDDEPTLDHKPAKSKPKSGANTRSTNTKVGKGINFNLPPLDTIEDIFVDMAAKAAQLGLSDVFQDLPGRYLNVATMCSGTESPLLALELLSKGLEQAGLPPIKVRHHFSAEIEVMKQGYIERNFTPTKLFRDVRDFIPEDSMVAVTAYGAEEPIPSALDILIAGFVCKDLSRLNSRQKDLESDGESGDTWRAIYSYAKRFRPSIVLLENVKSTGQMWKSVVSKWDKIDYEAAWLICDTKRYYLPQTRERMYMIAMDRRQCGNDAKKAVHQWQNLMQSLQRQCSSPYEAFLTNALQDSSEHMALASEPDWALCRLRYDHIRSDQRLGILRPITQWSENGTVRPPDFANRPWYYSQSSRVYDAIDVAHLQAAQKGHDSLYKMTVWDVSQNVDRFKAEIGILPCITPGGCDFASNRQQALNGRQLLLLQGMPMNKLLFGRESPRDCQDLAGNAMSTTVIGASLASALICGSRFFRSQPPSDSVSQHESAEVHAMRLSPMEVIKPATLTMEQVDLDLLKRSALLSSRLCSCESDKQISNASIHVCSSCAHTACARCAGNPKHTYAEMIGRDERVETPHDFIQHWRAHFPVRLRFAAFPDVRQLISSLQPLDKHTSIFIDCLVALGIASHAFCFRDIVRQDRGWKVAYSAPHAKLELRIGRDMEWFLFANCPSDLPGNSPVRKLFENPVAHAKVAGNLLDVSWKVHLPVATTHKLHVSGSAARYRSWRSQLGFPDYKSETVPVCLQIRGLGDNCESLVGDFHLLSQCGTASNSLYKRSTGSDLYLFLDPSLTGKSEDDGFVYSHDCGRKRYGEHRISSASINTFWRPWNIQDQLSHDVEAVVPGIWLAVAMRLETFDPLLDARVLVDGKSLAKLQYDCSRPLVLLEITTPERLSVDQFDGSSWVLQHAKSLPSFSTWQSSFMRSPDGCPCAPTHPPVLWHVDTKGVATPQEDRKAAASFERAIKKRPPVFQLQAKASTTGSEIQILLNVAALVHGATRHLSHSSAASTAWRLVVDHADLAPEAFPKFRLLSNSADTPCTLSPAISYLKHAQPRSLAWMKKQELGMAITITEVEEVVEPKLGWRAEARAQISLAIHGGVLADLPSFGKTVTTIALIQSEFEEHTPDSIIRNNRRLGTALPSHVDTAATLIVCPPHIALQWDAELKQFLGLEQYEAYNVLLVTSFSRLQQLSIDDLCSSRVVVVSWSVFAEDEYIFHMAQFTAMPEPSVTSRRAFDTWMRRALHEIPGQLIALQSTSYDAFQGTTKDKLEERLQHSDFQALLPIRIQHGSAYKSYKVLQATKAKAKGKTHTKRKPTTLEDVDQQIPLLHLMRYNRIVVDEYHYLNDDKKLSNVISSVSVKHIPAHKRWVLSGTPALGSFRDVDQIASYLGVKLGRHCLDDGKPMTRSEKTRKTETTLVEDFLSQTEIMSRQWHQARHQDAQQFLDLFVRQNEPFLGHISCVEEIMPVEIDAGHHAVYLELSQHLVSQKMQIKKLNNKLYSDKTDRLNASLNNSASAEDALLKSALVFESGLHLLTNKRAEQRRHTEAELETLMAGFEGLSKTDEISELYVRFKDDIKKFNWLGDSDASYRARRLLIKAEKSPVRSAFPELMVRGLSQEKRSNLAKKLLSNLRETAREFALRTRSERFINAVQSLTEASSNNELLKCSSPNCLGTANMSRIRLVTQCGHTACEDCLAMRADTDTCVHPLCSLAVQGVNLVKATDLGSAVKHVTEEDQFGRKLEAITRLISGLPKGDQGLVFAPNDEIGEVLERILDHHAIPYHSLQGCKASASAKVIEDFKNDIDPETQRKVLILNLGSESAAGVNLINANHVIFVSPLLSNTQYEFDSAMAQAIARSRRYGQEKRVHIYHVIAQRTIDVDNMEHRHKRLDAIATAGFSAKMPPSLAKRTKTRLVKNNAGEMALVPVPWLADVAARKTLGVNEVPETFTSLIEIFLPE
ncbi:hypothetical protein CC86DRAFT_334939 [Ophiobolus disseminans]|uniref:Helicase C-terminal domain-containing protein n=1 Tax=Ophiobolus disseminans TaxID=1469910 RepID=A0A6A6ZHN3_9PLEO|nr:hypothetical protein CC86DRAFT_334939 [Ophiobolus disseminans]